MIDITNEDFGTLIICALRYCQGRRTYMPKCVQDITRSHFNDLTPKTLSVLSNDMEYQAEYDIYGDDCDKRNWEAFWRDLEEFKRKRK